MTNTETGGCFPHRYQQAPSFKAAVSFRRRLHLAAASECPSLSAAVSIKIIRPLLEDFPLVHLQAPCGLRNVLPPLSTSLGSGAGRSVRPCPGKTTNAFIRSRDETKTTTALPKDKLMSHKGCSHPSRDT